MKKMMKVSKTTKGPMVQSSGGSGDVSMGSDMSAGYKKGGIVGHKEMETSTKHGHKPMHRA